VATPLKLSLPPLAYARNKQATSSGNIRFSAATS
jgi:hypothetical protein